MSRELLAATKEDGTRARFVLEVFQEGDHWTSTLAKLDERGEREATRWRRASTDSPPSRRAGA
jgi:hypothetical protein